ncbi:MAG TPA: oligosaccharide flippase family protein [Myxococcota bacterium]|nr:oligosaccharide flippase family protein [Myxococcota bacterium]HQK51106.1 oligosaccharide flippase family protein [Myxococcota bacterium]
MTSASPRNSPTEQETPPGGPPGSSRTAKALLLALGHLLNLLLGIALSSGLSWTLTDRGLYGAFQQVLLVYSILAGPLAVGLPNAVFHFLPRLPPPEQKAFLRATHLALAGSGAILAVLLWVGADWIGTWMDSPDLPPMIRTFSPLAAFLLPQMLLEPILICQSRLPLLVALQVTIRAAIAASVLVPLWAGADLITGIGTWVLSGILLQVLAMGLVFRPLRGVRAQGRPGLGREVVRFVAPIAVVTLISPLALMGDKALVSALFGAAAYGIYLNGSSLISLAYTVVLKAQGILLADFSGLAHGGRREELARLWRRATMKMGLVLFPLSAGMAAAAPDVVRILYSDRYLDSAPVMRLVSLGLLFRVLLSSPALQAFGRSGWYASGTVLSAVVAPVSVFVLGSSLGLGLLGAALGYTLTEAVHGAWQVLLIRRVLRFPIRQVLPVGRLVGLALWAHASAWGTLGLLIRTAPDWSPWVRLLVGGPAFLAAFLGGSLASGLLRAAEDLAPLLRLARVPEEWIAWLDRRTPRQGRSPEGPRA